MEDCGEDDEFWRIAIGCHGHNNAHNIMDGDDDETDDEDHDRSEHLKARSIIYNIPWKATTNRRQQHHIGNCHDCQTTTDHCGASFTIPLQLSPLPDNDGIWSPLGSQAWYASSLLLSLLLQSTILKPKNNQCDEESVRSLLSKHLESCFDDGASPSSTSPFTALELGSGAVGLVGIVLGLILGDYSSPTSRPVDVILTDNDAQVLQHLQQNVNMTLAKFDEDKTLPPEITLPRFHVELLDWNDYEETKFLERHNLVQLVVGSELVYTDLTAKSCAKVVLSVLESNPNALVVILQVADRDGWYNAFLPTLRQHADLQVIEEPMNDSDLHELACTIMPPGGTLDRFAFGACYILHKEGRVAGLFEELSCRYNS